MRLTLRTLLAWLDDKLPPSEVKEIGKQVAESDYAKELVDRIHKVTRQRRLSVPSSTGPEAADPSLVAAYIDNELDAEAVAEVEKKCLTSDVHLAEVSSVHQILSLIGQKAKVPTEARLRMYQLVKGREALRPRRELIDAAEPAPVSQPIQPWVAPLAPQRSIAQRYGPLAAVVGLIGILTWAAYSTLSAPEQLPTYRNIQIASNKTAPPSEPTPNPAPAAAPAPGTVEPGAPAVKSEPAPAVDSALKPEGDAGKKAAPGADIPAGAVAFAKKPTGLLLKYDADAREWTRLSDATPLRDRDRILSLEPFRATLEVGSANVELVFDSEVGLEATPKEMAGRLNLDHGRIVLHGNPSGQPFEIQAGDLTVTITPPPDVLVGVEKVTQRAPGRAQADKPGLSVLASEGSVTISSGKNTATLDAPGSLLVSADGSLSEPTNKPVPAWITEGTPAPFDQKVGEQFLQVVRPDRQILPSLVEASEDEQKDVCRLAITALKSVGDLSFVVPLLNRKGGPSATVARRTAIQVLRAHLAEGPEAAGSLREQLKRELGDEPAVTAEKLLVGYTEAEAKEEATYEQLVKLLGSTDDASLGIRELALDNLRQLTGRDDLDYDPEKPEGAGLKAWRELLKNHELKPAAPPRQG